MTWPVGAVSGGMIENVDGEGVGIYWKVLRFTADVGSLVWRHWGKYCADDLGTLQASGSLLSNAEGVSSPIQVNVSLATAFSILFVCFLGLFIPEVSWWPVLDLILYLIHSIIVIIDLIPCFCHLYFLKTFLDPSETTITVMVAPIIMTMISRAYYVRDTSSRWELAMMRLSVKMLNLSQCPPLPVAHHSLSSLLISKSMVAKSLSRSLVSGRCWLEVL